MKIEDVKVGMVVKFVIGTVATPRIGEIMKIDVTRRYPVEVLPKGLYHWVPVGFDEIEPVEIGG
jgi:hypothetical protein